MIMAWQKPLAGSLPCYSFGSMYRDCHDVTIAREVASACAQEHQVIPVGNEFLSQFDRYASRAIYLTDGCVDVSHATDLYVNERAAAIAPVRMTGNYGSEVLRRTRAFKPVAPHPGLFQDDFLPNIETARNTYSQVAAGHPLSFAVFKQAPWHHFGLLSLEQSQLCLRSPFLDNEFVRTVFQAPDHLCTNSDLSLRLIADGDAALARIPTDRGLLVGDDSITSRAVQGALTFTSKAEYAYDYGMPQWVASIDHLFRHLHLEKLFLGRHKFYHYRVWYRDALAPYVRDILLDSRTLARPYLRKEAVEAMVAGHLKGTHNFTTEIHKLLTLELVSRIFLDSAGSLAAHN
jgi:asparagine synthase (glutamine-hydrolysing)